MGQKNQKENGGGEEFNLGNRKMSPELNALVEAALESKDWEKVRSFLEMEYEEIGLETEGDETALDFAAALGYTDLMNTLMQNTQYSNQALEYACIQGNVDTLKELIQKGADVNAVDEDSTNMLTVAVYEGNLEIVKVLIEHGADVNKTDDEGNSALHAVAQHAHLDIVNVLIRSNADLNALNGDNESPLYMAVKSRHIPVMLQLLCFGAKIDDKVLKLDNSNVLDTIHYGLKMQMKTSLLSDEEKRYLGNLAFLLAKKQRGVSMKTYYIIRSFITYKGIFMAHGYDLGAESIWTKLSFA